MATNLDNIFNIASTEVAEVITPQGEVIVPSSGTDDTVVDADYQHTRSNLYALLHSGQEALRHALEVAKQSEHPRAFEVVGGLVKQLADVNHQLLDLSEKRQKLKTPPSKTKDGGPSNVTNNAIFVGSTAELNRMLNNMIKGE